jgi:hypothetical protein
MAGSEGAAGGSVVVRPGIVGTGGKAVEHPRQEDVQRDEVVPALAAG